MKNASLKKIFLIGLLLQVIAISSFSAIRLPNIIGSHMVIQQNAKFTIWGWGGPSEKITIKASWDTTNYSCITNSGAKWSTELNTPAAGGPYTISIKGDNSNVVLEDVMIGEVWVCSGQSNMEWSGDQGLQQTKDEAPNANINSIRLFYVPKATSDYPQENIDGRWVVCNPEDMSHFSAIGYFFGKNLTANLKAPIGLINSNWGGTPAETWTPSAVVENNETIKKGAAMLGSFPWWSTKTAVTYNAMIAPLTNFNIAGVIWYQGESNTGSYFAYEALFTGMIDAWRAAWKKDFPFYFMQIAPYTYGNLPIGALLREAQTKAALHPKTAMVVVSDLVPDTTNIHPTLKKEVAARLANLVLNKTYGIGSQIVNSPIYKSHTVEKDKIVISFDNAANGLVCKDKELSQFQIAGEDKMFVTAQAKIVGNTIVVSSKSIKNPIAVRYSFNNTAIGNVFNKEGLPLNLFRTDDWELIPSH